MVRRAGQLPIPGAVCPVWHRQTTDATREDSGRGGHDDRTTPQQQPHSPGTSRAVTVRPAGAPVIPPACEDHLRWSAGAVPDLTPTPRGPEAEVGNGSGKSEAQA